MVSQVKQEGIFLIASPHMDDPRFEKSVILLCHHDSEGALGIIVNKSIPLDISSVLESLNIDFEPSKDTFTGWGGPVGEDTGFVIWRGTAGEEEGWNVCSELAVSPSADRLSRLTEAGQRYFLALGYAGWGPGQLDAEIETGSWLFADADLALLFDSPAEERYSAALASLGLSSEHVWHFPADECC